MGLQAERVVYSDPAETALDALRDSKNPDHASIVRRVEYLEQRLVEDCQAGEVVPLPLPRKARVLQTRHAPLHNLYCCDLPALRRLLYTIVRDGPRRFVYVMEIVDHPAYSKWFPGRGH